MLFERTNIFESDPTHPHCHAPVIHELPNKELMAVWYAGQNEAHKSVGLKASWKPLQGGQWSTPLIIHKTPNRADGNAVITYYNNALYLFYDTIYSSIFPWCNVILNWKTSNDFGRTWSDSHVIFNERGFTVRNKPLIIGNRLIIPVGSEHILGDWSQMIITEDGVHYHLSQKIITPKVRNEQPTITQLANGNLLAYLRPSKNRIYQTTSKDLGETWSEPEQISLYNPNSALDFVRTAKGELLLVWNNNPKQGNMKANRKVINIGYSPDEGRTWPIIKALEEDPEYGNVAYPSIIQGSDGIFHILYNYRRKLMRYVRVDLDWVKSP